MVLLGTAIRTGVLDFTISENRKHYEADTSGEVPRDESPGTELQYITIRSIINQPLLHY